jgi:hypothetical protein
MQASTTDVLRDITEMKVYLDNNIVCAIAKDDYPAESSALDRLLKVMEEGKVNLVTSELTLQEIGRYQGPERALHGSGPSVC